MSKEKQFFDILKKYGITEYWCSKEFDPKDEYPGYKVVIPTNDPKPANDIYDLYTPREEDGGQVIVFKEDKNSDFFNVYTKGLERRQVL